MIRPAPGALAIIGLGEVGERIGHFGHSIALLRVIAP
jgi:hypothetical protein